MRGAALPVGPWLGSEAYRLEVDTIQGTLEPYQFELRGTIDVGL